MNRLNKRIENKVIKNVEDSISKDDAWDLFAKYDYNFKLILKHTVNLGCYHPYKGKPISGFLTRNNVQRIRGIAIADVKKDMAHKIRQQIGE